MSHCEKYMVEKEKAKKKYVRIFIFLIIFPMSPINSALKKKGCSSGCSFVSLGDDVFLGLDIDTVEELTDILVLDEAELVDLGGFLGDVVDGVALEDELVLGDLNVGTVDLDGGADDLLADALLTQEVADLDLLSLAGDVDGEVSAGEAELIAEALGDAGDEVLDGGDGGVDAAEIAAATEPADDGEELLLVVDADVEVEVLKVLGEGAAGALDGDDAALSGDGDLVGDGELANRLDLHFFC